MLLGKEVQGSIARSWTSPAPLHQDSRRDRKARSARMLYFCSKGVLGKEVSKASIAKILDVSRSALYHFIKTRKIVPD